MLTDLRRIALLFLVILVAAVSLGLVPYVALSPLPLKLKLGAILGLLALVVGCCALYHFLAKRPWSPGKLVGAGVAFLFFMPSLTSSPFARVIGAAISLIASKEQVEGIDDWIVQASQSLQGLTAMDVAILVVGLLMIAGGIYWDWKSVIDVEFDRFGTVRKVRIRERATKEQIHAAMTSIDSDE